VTEEEGKRLAQELNIPLFMEVSARQNINIDECFHSLTQLIYTRGPPSLNFKNATGPKDRNPALYFPLLDFCYDFLVTMPRDILKIIFEYALVSYVSGKNEKWLDVECSAQWTEKDFQIYLSRQLNEYKKSISAWSGCVAM
jgi:hypothetical protein